jgi:hypothetical protein
MMTRMDLPAIEPAGTMNRRAGRASSLRRAIRSRGFLARLQLGFERCSALLIPVRRGFGAWPMVKWEYKALLGEMTGQYCK